jgi:amino acid adenylation domain-containing protein
MMIELDRDEGSWKDRSCKNPDPQKTGLDFHHLVYVIYTSGSTGIPKGVMVEHRGFANLIHWYVDQFDGSARDKVLIATSQSFDLTQKNIFAPLTVGGCLQLSGPVFDPEQIVSLVKRKGASMINMAPSAFHALIEADREGHLCTLNRVVLGGEPIETAMLRKIPSPRPAFVNSYGPTECTDVVGFHRLSGDLGQYVEDRVPLGRPIANTRIYILDSCNRPVPVGVAGELCIAGVQVARGYLNRPELSAERFLPDPFAGPTPEEPDPRMYKTGDLGRWLADGTIEFLGRNDFQVKIRGYRIEPGEIEAGLTAHPAVREAVVLVREDVPGDKRLVAYYTGDADPAAESLCTHLSGVLPEYMVPAAYVQLDALPLTPNGKIDRKALPAPEGGAWRACAYKPPVGLLEQNLTAIWAKLFQMKWIGRFDNFFDLGGHSLMAMQMVSMMKQRGIDVQVAALFAHPTIERLAAYIEGEEKPILPDGAVPIRREGKGTPLFLVHELSGDVFYAMSLVHHIDTDIPVYGLAGTPLGETPLRTIHAEARRLIRIIRRVQPHGPYRIAGWSLGGNIAYEIATQLLGEDQDVAFVGLIDSINVIGIHPRERHPRDDNLIILNYALQQMDETDDSLKDKLNTLSKTADLETFIQACQEKQLLAPRMSLKDIKHYLTRAKGYRLALNDYYPQPIPVPIYLLKAIEKEEDDPIHDYDSDGHLGWAKALPKARIHVIPVPGTHSSMLSPTHIDVLGRSLTDAIRQAGVAGKTNQARHDTHLVTIQAGQEGMPPLFCVPGAGANITDFIHLAAALDDKWPIHGLQPRGMNDGHAPHATVPAAAQAYMRVIDEEYPEGPLHLLGHSFGGWVVFEMALRLRAFGRMIASVTLIDAEAPEGDGILGREYNRTEMFMKLVELSEQRAECSLNLTADDFDGLDYAAQLRLIHGRLVGAKMILSRSTPRVLRGMVRTFATHLRTTYVPHERYPGPVRLVLVRDAKDDEATCREKHKKRAAKWQRFAPGLVTWRGPGNHMTILHPPHVVKLADLLCVSLCNMGETEHWEKDYCEANSLFKTSG